MRELCVIEQLHYEWTHQRHRDDIKWVSTYEQSAAGVTSSPKADWLAEGIEGYLIANQIKSFFSSQLPQIEKICIMTNMSGQKSWVQQLRVIIKWAIKPVGVVCASECVVVAHIGCV